MATKKLKVGDWAWKMDTNRLVKIAEVVRGGYYVRIPGIPHLVFVKTNGLIQD